MTTPIQAETNQKNSCLYLTTDSTPEDTEILNNQEEEYFCPKANIIEGLINESNRKLAGWSFIYEMNDKKRVILGMTGATGQIIGIEILKILSDLERVETHLIISRVAGEIIHYESELKISEVKEKADEIYNNKEVGAPPASGSFKRAGMIVAPCSMKTLSALANAYSNNLIVRAGDVTLKERRKLITIPREKPLNSIHLKNMLKLSNAGGIIMPPVPSFYFKPEKVTDVVKEIALKAIDLLDIINRPLRTEWKGFEKTENSCP